MAVDRFPEQNPGITDISPFGEELPPPIPFRQRKGDPLAALHKEDALMEVELPGVVRRTKEGYLPIMMPRSQADYLTGLKEELIALQSEDSDEYYK